jgi:hypothetical protein
MARTKVVKQYGLERILKPLIDDMKTLETEGIMIKFAGMDTVLKGSIATISADNLASHQIGGFRQTFSSGKICRYCLADYETLNCFRTEENCVIRTAEGHVSHLAAIDQDDSCKRTYGVQCKSVFSDLTYFSVVESLPPDAMHDILEGLCPINVKIVLQYLIRNKKLNTKTYWTDWIGSPSPNVMLQQSHPTFLMILHHVVDWLDLHPKTGVCFVTFHF